MKMMHEAVIDLIIETIKIHPGITSGKLLSFVYVRAIGVKSEEIIDIITGLVKENEIIELDYSLEGPNEEGNIYSCYFPKGTKFLNIESKNTVT